MSDRRRHGQDEDRGAPSAAARAPAGRAIQANGSDRVTTTLLPGDREELAAAIPGRDGPWGALLVVAAPGETYGASDRDLITVLADAIGAIVGVVRREEEVAHLLHRAEALRRVAADIGSGLDLDRILAGLVEHTMVLFEGDRGAVFLRQPDGRAVAEVSRGLSTAYLNAVRDFPERSLPTAAVAARQPLFATRYRDDPRGPDVRAAVVQEGFDTICTAPLLDGEQVLGMLNVYHDSPHEWTDDELETIAALATQASVAIRTAQNFEQMATWTAQLQSIQQLGARLNHLSNVRDIGLAIGTELRQLIDYHNVRVYRLVGARLVPVAMKGHVGEYVDETPDQLRVEVGEGITGWVAEHRVAQIPARRRAPTRARTRSRGPRTTSTSRCCSRRCCSRTRSSACSSCRSSACTSSATTTCDCSSSMQASPPRRWPTPTRRSDCASSRRRSSSSSAASAALLQITESILTTLDGRAVLEGITERLGGLIACDNVAIEVLDPATGLLTPLTARGVHAGSLPRAVGAGRDRPRDLGGRPQRAGLRRGRATRPAGQSLPWRRDATTGGRSTAASSSSRCAVGRARSAC